MVPRIEVPHESLFPLDLELTMPLITPFTTVCLYFLRVLFESQHRNYHNNKSDKSFKRKLLLLLIPIVSMKHYGYLKESKPNITTDYIIYFPNSSENCSANRCSILDLSNAYNMQLLCSRLSS